VVGPIVRGYDPPDSPYGSGHRGIDIAVPPGTVAVAPATGTVKFAGPVGGQLFVSIAHDGGLESTFSWVSKTLVRKGDTVFAGQPLALTGQGHPGSVLPHLHFGAKRDGSYVDPLSLLAPASVVDLIHLVPLTGEAAIA
jgi:murein DD-endopeptidase MepM/ murein hydrolase activator NlpD